MSTPASGPFFLGTGKDERFCFAHAPRGTSRGGVLAIHAFAEEMNRTRAAVAEAARALADAGYVVLQIDLAGCGDSAGDFADASWTQWLADLELAWSWLGRHADGPRWLWGTRLGALLADAFAATCVPAPDGLLFWQPVVNGAQHLNQFLRLKAMSNVLRGAQAGVGDVAKEASPRDEFAAGRSVEVAGYTINAALAAGIDAAQMGKHARLPARIHWLQVSSQGASPASPVSERLIEKWRGAGASVDLATVAGSPFWQTLETERCPALVDATVERMRA